MWKEFFVVSVYWYGMDENFIRVLLGDICIVVKDLVEIKISLILRICGLGSGDILIYRSWKLMLVI